MSESWVGKKARLASKLPGSMSCDVIIIEERVFLGFRSLKVKGLCSDRFCGCMSGSARITYHPWFFPWRFVLFETPDQKEKSSDIADRERGLMDKLRQEENSAKHTQQS
jgi:hypothetical protein